MLALSRSVVASESAAALVRELLSREVLARLAAALRVDQPELGASLAASRLVGVALVRYVVRLEPIASAPAEVVGDWFGPAIQRLLSDPAALAADPG